MEYIDLGKFGKIANPKNWEELKYTLHNEQGIIKKDKNTDKGKNNDLMAMFLKD